MQQPDEVVSALEESTELLMRAVLERDGVCHALGVDLDVEEGELALVAGRVVADLEASERLAAQLLEVATSMDVEVRLLRHALSDTAADAARLRELLREAMGVFDLGPAELGSVSAFIAQLHDIRAREMATAAE